MHRRHREEANSACADECAAHRIRMVVFTASAMFASTIIQAAVSADAAKGEEIKDFTPYISLLETREASLRSFLYECRTTREYPGDNWKLDPRIYSQMSRCRITRFAWQGDMTMEVNAYGESPQSCRVGVQSCWNGKAYKRYYPKEAIGAVDLQPSPSAQFLFSPLDMARLSYPYGDSGTSLARLFRMNPKLWRISQSGGSDLLLLEFPVGLSFWLDPNKNLLVVRQARYFPSETKPPEGLPESDFVEVLESKEVQPGFWLPTKWVRTQRIGPPAAREHWGKISMRETYEVTQLEVNSEIPPETFELKFPEGTHITNMITERPEVQGAEGPVDPTLLGMATSLSKKGPSAVGAPSTDTAASLPPTMTAQRQGLSERRPDIPAGARPVAPAARLGALDVLWRVLLGVAALSILLGVWAAVRRKGRSAGGGSSG